MAGKLPPNPVGVPPGHSYWNDWLEKLRDFVDQALTSVDWGIVINTPTTLSGYGVTSGITDTIALAKLTPAGADGSLTVVEGLITAYTPPT